jgi:hypothetical protein
VSFTAAICEDFFVQQVDATVYRKKMLQTAAVAITSLAW